DREIGGTTVVWVNPALQAHLGGTASPSLLGATDDLVEREVVGTAAQCFRRLAFGKSAEPAAKAADIRVVDVAVDDKSDNVAAHLLTQRVRGGCDIAEVDVARREEADELLLFETRASLGGAHDGGNVAIDLRKQRRCLLEWHRKPRRPRVYAGKTFR